ncbi:sensor histidine kinase [Klebsiella quasipneumoniae]|uniref:sensor histidine kinase n=1 Tax=Klebsiella quasipneumoniae TaxID=1463165 RepID=UPI001BACB5D2|nr:ATP-binding protein [Klebsiella quasipneumoniae]MBS3678251.1 sensor histidine kinase [Klebsiella quasipneumoniae]
MDGFKRGMKNSLQLRLSIALCSAIVMVAAVSGAVTFFSALEEAHELQDSTLTQIVDVIKNSQLSSHDISYISPSLDGEADSNVIVQMISDKFTSSDTPPNYFKLPQNFSDGFQTIPSPNGPYRVLIAKLSHNLHAVVGQKTAVRDEVALDSAWRTLMPFLVLLPVLLLVVTLLVRNIFRPLSQLASEVNQRDEKDLTPLVCDTVPKEVQPFIIAINRLLSKVDSAMEAQRRFVADAAHELRSPLTALSLQAERLSQSTMPAEAQSRLARLRHGINRAKSLLEQLLSLARAQEYVISKCALVSFQTVSRQVIESLLPLALDKRMDLGVVTTEDIFIKADEIAIFTVIKNLLENAIKYTPPEGCIDIRFYKTDTNIVLEVEDNGPGILPENRQRVFDPFYRIEGSEQSGSGLGLSIVQTTVTRLGGEILLLNAVNYPTGLYVKVLLPISLHET